MQVLTDWGKQPSGYPQLRITCIMLTFNILEYPLKCAPAKQQLHTSVEISTVNMIIPFCTSSVYYSIIMIHPASRYTYSENIPSFYN